jgi:hypothetical protein
MEKRLIMVGKRLGKRERRVAKAIYATREAIVAANMSAPREDHKHVIRRADGTLCIVRGSPLGSTQSKTALGSKGGTYRDPLTRKRERDIGRLA